MGREGARKEVRAWPSKVLHLIGLTRGRSPSPVALANYRAARSRRSGWARAGHSLYDKRPALLSLS